MGRVETLSSILSQRERRQLFFLPLGEIGLWAGVYFMQRGMEIVILLAGGDKSTQSKDIKAALKIARQL